MNSITVAGNISQEVEIRYTNTGDAVANFSIADNQGKDKEAIFWRCSLFGKRATSLEPYLTKGQYVTVSGGLSKHVWTDKQGNEREQFEIRVNELALQGSPREGADAARTTQKKPSPSPSKKTMTNDDIDQDIPF